MVSIIILAAGESKRFGSPKQLAKIGSQTLIERLINTLKKTKAEEIIVVLGAHKEKIQEVLPKDIKICINKNYQLGQTSSLKAGLNCINERCEYFMVLPVDSAVISPETINLIINKFKDQKFMIGIPIYQGKRGHPPIYKSNIKNQILKLKDDEPLYKINQKFAAQTLEISVDDPGILSNINTPEDLKKIQKSLNLS